jgi:hypothetical protein
MRITVHRSIDLFADEVHKNRNILNSKLNLNLRGKK